MSESNEVVVLGPMTESQCLEFAVWLHMQAHPWVTEVKARSYIAVKAAVYADMWNQALAAPAPGQMRVQIRRTKGWRMPPNTVKVDRSSGFGNPFSIAQARPLDGKPLGRPWWVSMRGGANSWMCISKAEASDVAVKLFRQSMTDLFRAKVRLALRGKNLACWCPLDQPCHADVLLTIANQERAA